MKPIDENTADIDTNAARTFSVSNPKLQELDQKIRAQRDSYHAIATDPQIGKTLHQIPSVQGKKLSSFVQRLMQTGEEPNVTPKPKP